MPHTLVRSFGVLYTILKYREAASGHTSILNSYNFIFLSYYYFLKNKYWIRNIKYTIEKHYLYLLWRGKPLQNPCISPGGGPHKA